MPFRRWSSSKVVQQAQINQTSGGLAHTPQLAHDLNNKVFII